MALLPPAGQMDVILAMLATGHAELAPEVHYRVLWQQPHRAESDPLPHFSVPFLLSFLDFLLLFGVHTEPLLLVVDQPFAVFVDPYIPDLPAGHAEADIHTVVVQNRAIKPEQIEPPIPLYLDY